MKRPFRLTVGLTLLAAAAAGYVGPLYEESGETCGSLLRPELTTFCDPYEQRRQVLLLLLLGLASPFVLVGLRRSAQPGREPRRGSWKLAAAAGLLTIPIAVMILVPVAVLNYLTFGFTQAQTGLPYIFAPAALAVGALVAARLAVQAGAAAGTALAAAAVGLPLVLSVQAVAEAFRWRFDDLATPLQLSGPFAYNQGYDAAAFVSLALAAIPMPVLLGLAARSHRQIPAGMGVGLLFLSALTASALFEATDNSLYAAASINWLPLLLVPAGLAVLAWSTRPAPPSPAAPQPALMNR